MLVAWYGEIDFHGSLYWGANTGGGGYLWAIYDSVTNWLTRPIRKGVGEQ